MSKKLERIKKKEWELIMRTLFNAAQRMTGDMAVSTFITTMLTESEQVKIGRRILIAQMILSGKKQAEIMYELNVSPNTFSRTRTWLQGQIPEYDRALKEFQNEQTKQEQHSQKKHAPPIGPTSFAALRKKFPAHFLLFTVFEDMYKSK